ncbi:hypothetical protein [Streptomyces sp. NPDC001851]|uniref:hypothetical protein n=1 Tax=Streptomyces sp. NPDC001851 TaxID=3154529 RepID=UPI0033187D97
MLMYNDLISDDEPPTMPAYRKMRAGRGSAAAPTTPTFLHPPPGSDSDFAR